MTIRVLAFSRAVVDDAGTLSPFEYNGSFQASLSDWAKAYQGHDCAKLLIGWARMMDCFDEFLFIAEESKETATGSLWKLEEEHYKAGLALAYKLRSPAIAEARNTSNTVADALALGYTRRIWAENATLGFDCLVKPDADLEGRFVAFDMENNEWLKINGWHFDIDG